MRFKRIIIIVLIIVSGILYYNYSPGENLQKVDVKRIIDGDTIELENGFKVRLMGINVPERGMPDYDVATAFLSEQLEGQNVQLKHMDTDRYGRILGYLFVSGQNINQKILKGGFGHLYYYDKDQYYNDLSEAEAYARKNKLGIWQESVSSQCLKLIELDYYDKGEDQETLSLSNNCGQSVDVIIKDDATHIYKETIPPGLFTKTFKNIFNDNGDTLYIWDEEGKMILYHRY